MSAIAGMVGLDEAGRGAWAGPLVVGAVGLKRPIEGLKDSKLVSPRKRVELVEVINQEAWFVGLGQATPAEIDKLGLTQATSLAMVRAIKGLPVTTKLIIDGPFNYLPERPDVQTQINADATVTVVMAASIVAKVERDRMMKEYAARWPVYGFDRHVGYGTTMHQAAIKQHGACELHRLSYQPLRQLTVEL